MSQITRKFIFVLANIVTILSIIITININQTQAQTKRPLPVDPELLPYWPIDEEEQTPFNVESATQTTLSWSQIVIQKYNSQYKRWELFLSNDDGTASQLLTNGIYPNLNKGNSQLAFSSINQETYEIYKFDILTRNQTRLTHNNSDDVRPEWSPDGSKIAFESYQDGQAEVYIMNKDGQNLVRLTNHAGYDGMPTWSPDGNQLAFVSSRSGGYRIWIMNADGNNPKQLSTANNSFRPKWSPDGNRIAFDADPYLNDRQLLMSISIDGSNQKYEHSEGGYKNDVLSGGWSPDGQYIVFTYVKYTDYQGQWYWWESTTHAKSISTHNVIPLGNSNDWRNWYPHWQTKDTHPPVSSVQITKSISPSPIHVNWSGSDTGGAGLRQYDTQVKIGASGIWTPWLTNTTQTSASYPGIGGTTYYFRSRATDNAYNYEAWPSGHDALATIEALPPVSEFIPISPFSRYDEPLSVSWTGYDPGQSGIKSFDIDHQINAGEWTRWQEQATGFSAVFEGASPGESHQYRIRATDNAENVSTWNSELNSTTFYKWGITGNTYDNTGIPASNINLESSTAIGVQNSNKQGEFAAYFSDDAPSSIINWQSDKYLDLPNTEHLHAEDTIQDLFMPPSNNNIVNWGFENAEQNDEWHFSGNISGTITNTFRHTGNQATLLGNALQIQDTGVVPTTGSRFNFWFEQDKQGIGHLLVRENLVSIDDFYYMQLRSDNTWSAPEIIDPTGVLQYNTPVMLVSDEGYVHVLWQDESGDPLNPTPLPIMYSMRDLDGSWTTPEIVAMTEGSNVSFYANLGKDNNVHVLFVKKVSTYGNYTELFYKSRNATGWSSEIQISNDGLYPTPADANLNIDKDGNVHITWIEQGDYRLFYRQKTASGIWESSKEIADIGLYSHSLQTVVDAKGHIHIIWSDTEDTSNPRLIYLERNENKQWKQSIIIDQGFNIANPQIATSQQGIVHVVWYTNRVYYTWRDKNNQWHYPQSLTQNQDAPYNYYTKSLQMDVDQAEVVYFSWIEVINDNPLTYNVYYGQKDSTNNLKVENVSEIIENRSGIPYLPIQFSALDSASPYILWLTGITPPLYYTTPAIADITGTALLSTTVTIPDSMSNPTLSFVYELSGSIRESDELFTILVGDGSHSTNVYSTSDSTTWKHHWIDMSPWTGQTVTISFILNETANTPRGSLLIDEVTLGSRFQDLQVNISDGNTALSKHGTLVIAYENRGHTIAENVQLHLELPDGLKFYNADITPTYVASDVIWTIGNIPPDSGLQRIEVEVEVLPDAESLTYLTTAVSIISDSDELELLNNSSQGTFFTGASVYLPIISKN